MIERGELRHYQVADLCFYMEGDRGGNLSDPGTGKTPSVCTYLFDLWASKQTRMIWTMPKSLMDKNLKELLKFSLFEEGDVVIYDGTPKQRQQILDNSDAKVWIMGFKRFADDWHILLDRHPDIGGVAVDEFHMGFGNFESGQSQELVNFCRKTKYFLPMTGTLVDGRLDSVYTAIHIIEPLYYSSKAAFLREHEIKGWDGKRIGWKGHDKIRSILAHHCIRRTFEMVYGKEEPVIIPERVKMSPKQRQVYDKFEKDAIIELENSFLSGALPGVNQIRCRQIMEHPECIRDPETGEVNDLMKGEVTGKDERLIIHLVDHYNSGKPLILFGALIPSLERMAKIAEQIGLRVGLIHGGISRKKRNEIDLAFQNGELDVVVCSPATAAVGYNWGHVDHIIFASIDYKDTNFVQAYRRAIRGKRDCPLWITILEYENSVDQRVFEIVEIKSKDANLVDPTRNVIDLSGGDLVEEVDQQPEP